MEKEGNAPARTKIKITTQFYFSFLKILGLATVENSLYVFALFSFCLSRQNFIYQAKRK